MNSTKHGYAWQCYSVEVEFVYYTMFCIILTISFQTSLQLFGIAYSPLTYIEAMFTKEELNNSIGIYKGLATKVGELEAYFDGKEGCLYLEAYFDGKEGCLYLS
ncbi:hypothetical protein AB6A40_008233 [Gnathostoma spinigerum]|uniref:Uncharacterized protein n=1 Tax=Gnathostoma spinigerum TaxID=75299 RepID=A0ABD6ENG7_9BILA